MKKLLSIVLALVMLAGLTVPAFADTDYSTGTPWPDTDLVGVVTEDTPTSLKDNFALYINKDKILTTEIPTGYSTAGTMIAPNIQVTEDIKNMFLGDAPEGHDALLAYKLYQLLMDWDSRNAQGAAPLKAQIDALEAIDSVDALTKYFVEIPGSKRLGVIWSAGTGIDSDDASRYVLNVNQCGTLLGDSAEYEKLTDYGAIKKAAYTELAQRMLVKMGYTEDEAQQKIDNCLAFEALMAPAMYSSEEQRRPDYTARSLNRYTLDQLKQAEGKLPILEVLAAKGYPECDKYIVKNPAFLEKLNELYTDENLTLIKDFIIVNNTLKTASILDRECYEWYNDCQNAVTGATGILDDETVASSTVAGTLAWPVAQLYTETYLKQEDKDRVSELIDEIQDAYHGIINEADFLSDATKAAAIEKLESMKKFVLFPDDWSKYDCDGLEFDAPAEGGTLWQAMENISDYSTKESVEDFSEPVDHDMWMVTPQTVNCFYAPSLNSMMILGAFAQGEVYNSDMSDEELYATLGVVIGHEISHGFDSNGAQYDKDGNLRSWWTDEDYQAFLQRNEKMVAYYNNMHPWEGQDFHGSIMTGEACADMAGFKVMLRLASEKENFDYDLFFRTFANLWLTQDTLQMSYARINDVHPMGYLRINATLQQYDEFLNFYGITEGDGMYLAPADRVAIW